MVEGNPFLTVEDALPHFPERWAPYLIYDCIKPLEMGLKITDGIAGLYVEFPIASDEPVGKKCGEIRVNDLTIPVEIEVFSYVTPDETSLKIINGFSRPHIAMYHQVEENTPEFDRLDTAYLNMLRRMHQNMLYAPGPKVTDLGDNR